MKRYDCAQQPTEADAGEWVRYSDVEVHNAACLRTLNELLENVRLSGLEAEAKLDAAIAKAEVAS